MDSQIIDFYRSSYEDRVPVLSVEYWKDHIGEKADIVSGDVVLAEDGFLTVSSSPKQNSLYVNLVDNKVQLIIPKDDYRGREYRFYRQDCARLCAQWLDAEYDNGAVAYVDAVSLRAYRELGMYGFTSRLGAINMFEVEGPPQHGDMILYGRVGHAGICLDGDKILHHLPFKYSSIDKIEDDQILGIFRHDAYEKIAHKWE